MKYNDVDVVMWFATMRERGTINIKSKSRQGGVVAASDSKIKVAIRKSNLISESFRIVPAE